MSLSADRPFPRREYLRRCLSLSTEERFDAAVELMDLVLEAMPRRTLELARRRRGGEEPSRSASGAPPP